MINSGLNNKTFFIALFLLIPLSNLTGQNDNIELTDTIYTSIFTGQNIKLDDFQTLKVKKQVFRDLHQLNNWKSLDLKGKVDNFFVSYTSTEKILKELFLSKSNATGEIGLQETVEFINQKINLLDEAKELLKTVENNNNITLYPFKDTDKVADNEKIGFVNSFDYLIRTIKFKSFEANKSINNIASFKVESIHKDTISILSDVFKNTILQKIESKSDEEYDSNSVLSELKDCKQLSGQELITEINSIGNKFLRARQKLFQNNIRNNSELIELLKNLNLFDKNILREELIENLRQLYYNYRVFIRELGGINTQVNGITLTDIGLDSDSVINNHLNAVFDNKNLNFFELIGKLNQQSITKGYSQKAVTQRMLSNAISRPLNSFITDLYSQSNVTIINLPTLDSNKYFSREIESFFLNRLVDLSQVFKNIELHNYESEKDTFSLKVVPDRVAINIDGDKLKFDVSASVMINWISDNRSSGGKIIDLDLNSGELDLQDIGDVLDTQDYIKLFETQRNIFLDSLSSQFNVPILNKLDIKSIQLDEAKVIINKSNNVEININEILDLIANGSFSESLKDLAIEYFEKIMDEEGESFLLKINDSILNLTKSLDPSSTIDDYFPQDLINEIKKGNIQINKNSFEYRIPIYYQNDQSNLLGSVFLKIPYSNPKNTEPHLDINKRHLLNLVIGNFKGVLQFMDTRILDSIYSTSVHLKTLQGGLIYLGELKYDIKINKSIVFDLELKNQIITIGNIRLKFQELNYEVGSKSFKGKVKLVYDDFELLVNKEDFENETFDIVFSQDGMLVRIINSNNLIVKSNEYLIKNNLLKPDNKIVSIEISNVEAQVVLKNSTYNIDDFINSLVKEKFSLVSKNINDFISDIVPDPLINNEQIEIKLKNEKTLEIYIKNISRTDYSIGIDKTNGSPSYFVNTKLLDRLDQYLNNILVESTTIESDNLNIRYNNNKSKFKIDVVLDGHKIIVWVDLKGNLKVDQESLKIFAKSTALNLGLDDLKKDIKSWLNDQLKLVKPEYLDINLTPSEESFNNGIYVLDIIIRDFINEDTTETFLGLNNILVKRTGVDNLKFDFSRIVENTEHIKDILKESFDNDNIEIASVNYINKQNDIGVINVSSMVTIPYINYKMPVDFNLDLKSMNARVDVDIDNGFIVREVFRSLKKEHFDNKLKNKTFSLNELELTVLDMKVLETKNQLELTTVISIPSVDISTNFSLFIDKNFKVRSKPEDIGELLAQQTINQLTDKAINEVKQLFPLLEEYVTIDRIIPIRKINKDLNIALPRGLRIESSAKIYELFEVSLPPLLITTDGVEVDGPKSVRFVYSTPIFIPPVFFLKDIGGTLSEKELEGEAKFLAGEENLIRIDGTFRVPFEGDSRLYLNGDLILFNSFNLASSKSYLNINKAHFKSTLETSKSISSLFYFNLDTEIKAKGKDWFATADGRMEVFKVFKGDANATFDKNHFDAQFSLDKTPIPLFPSSQVELKAGKMFSNPEIKTQTDVSIRGNNIAGVKGSITSSYSSLAFKFLGMNLGVTVPSYKDLDEDLIWDLIKNLLNPDFENLDEALVSLLQGNININPFSGFGSGGDGIAANGNSKGGNDAGGNGSANKKSPYKNGKAGAKEGQGGTMGYADIAAEVNEEGFEGKWVGTSTSLNKMPNSSITEQRKSNPKEDIKVSVNTINPDPNGSVDLFKKIGANKYTAYKFRHEISKTPHLENLEIPDNLLSKNNDAFYTFKKEVSVVFDYEGKLAFVFGEELYLFTTKQLKPLKLKLKDLNWENYAEKEFNKSNAFTKMMCALNEVFQSDSIMILDNKNPLIKENNNVLIIVKNRVESQANFKILGVVDNKCLKFLKDNGAGVAIPNYSDSFSIKIDDIIEKHNNDKKTCCTN